jgi:hypothetical protein
VAEKIRVLEFFFRYLRPSFWYFFFFFSSGTAAEQLRLVHQVQERKRLKRFYDRKRKLGNYFTHYKIEESETKQKYKLGYFLFFKLKIKNVLTYM